jgi:hypothetical protein
MDWMYQQCLQKKVNEIFIKFEPSNKTNLKFLLGDIEKTITENAATLRSGTSAPLDLNQYPGEECYRRCNWNDTRVCYFRWNMEHFHAMGP